LYVSDGHNNRVLVYNLDSNKNLIDRIPDVVLGQPNFYSMSAGQGANGMTSPTCLDIDETRGYLFVCDKGNQRILVFDVSGGATDHMNASYVLGQTSLVSTTLDTTPTQDRIGEPVALAYDPSSVAKDLYVIDGANNRLLSFDTATLANGISAAHILNASTFNYSASINANDPYRGLAIDTARHYLYVGRFDGTTTSDVAVYNVTTGPSNNMTPFATTNTFTGDVQGLSYSSTSQSLFVSNSSEHRVYVYDFFTITNGEDPEGVLGQNSFSTNTPGTSQGQFGNPIGSVFDEINRRLYLIDSYNSRVLIYNFISLDTPSLPSGNVGTPYSATLTAQNYQGVYFFIEAIAGSLPPGISINYSALVGTPTTSGTYNFTLRSYDEFGVSKFYSNQHDTLITIADADPLPYLASYVLYQPDFISGGPSLTQPKVVFDEINHRVFVSNGTQATISSFDLDASNNFPDFISDGQLGTGVMTPSNNSFGSDTTGLYGGITPIALAVDSTHQRLFVSDSNRVLVFDVTSGINSSNTAVNILGGQPDYNSNNVLPVAQNTSTATALAYDESRQVLFVADGTRIAVFDVAPAGSRTITLCGNTTNGIVDNMNASCVLDWSGSGGFITELALDEARGLLFAINASGLDLAVFDVRQAGSPAVTICGNSSTGIANGQTPLCPTAWWGTYLNSYAYIAYDKGRQQLFFNDNIGTLIFDVSDLSTGLPATPRAVLGRFDANAYTVMLNTPNQASLGNMTFGVPALGGVVDAGNNRYYVADAGYDRIMIFNFVEITTPSLPAGTVGSAYSQTLATANSQGTVSFAVTGGALPAGLSLSSGGIISGTPTTAGTYSVTIQATDAFPNASNFISSAKTFTIQVNDVVVADLCPNIAGNQVTVPSGMIIDGSGNCVPGGGGPSWCQDPLASNFGGPLPCTYPGADLCPNIAGTQLTIPSGMYIDLSGNCVSSGGPDLCPNISGVQVVVPSGYIVDGFGNCVEPPPVDLCPNIVGSQSTVPSGMYIDSFGNCVTPTSTTGPPWKSRRASRC
jgi:6-phosphogluconolactonase (cycloisomerase 2 family)